MSGISREIHHRPRGLEASESSPYCRSTTPRRRPRVELPSQGREPSRRRQMVEPVFALFCKLQSVLSVRGAPLHGCAERIEKTRLIPDAHASRYTGLKTGHKDYRSYKCTYKCTWLLLLKIWEDCAINSGEITGFDKDGCVRTKIDDSYMRQPDNYDSEARSVY